jgi:hypothetical protein
MEKCPICNNPASIHHLETAQRINCDICGPFNIGWPIPEFTEDEKIKLRYHYAKLKPNDKKRVKEYITNANKDDFLKKLDDIPLLLKKIDLVLEYFDEKTKFFHQEISINMQKDYRLFFCRNRDEFQEIIDYLKKLNYIRILTEGNISSFHLLPDGLKYLEGTNKKRKYNQCFVAMWFNDKTEKAYSEAILPAIKNDSGYEAYKVNNNDEKNGWIPDTIIKEIKRSKFMVVDLTGYRAGVYYEAGFAEGIGLEVIYTCNENWFNNSTNEIKMPFKCKDCGNNEYLLDNVHFNLKQRKMILWNENNLTDFRISLSEKIGAIIGINENR